MDMKKQILLGSALLVTVAAYSQQTSRRAPQGSSIVNGMQEMATRFDYEETESKVSVNNLQPASRDEAFTANAKSAGTAITNAVKFSGSMNILSVLVSGQKILQWNDEVNMVSFVHRKSATYVAGSNSNSGSIVASLSTNMGLAWDSVCMWTNAANLARYPQGGLYNPIGNTNPNNTYVVGCGPVTSGSGWTGNWYASRSVSMTPKNMPGGDQQYFPNNTVIGNMYKHDFSRLSFSSTDDGVVRSLGGIYNGLNSSGNPTGYRGALVVKGTFNAGSFVWSSDSIAPTNVVITSTGEKQLGATSVMAWNESGTTGYVVLLGARTGQTLANQGFQPIVYKTTNSGSSWVLMNSMDFNSPALQFVNDRLAAVNTNSNLAIPYFYTGEGMDATVDNSGNLHLAVTVVGTARQHPDSLAYIYGYSPNNTRFPFQPGAWPYVYDFTLNGANQWSAHTVDTLQTQGCGITSTQGGYTVNAWVPDANGQKVSSDSRIQFSRTPAGDKLALVWAETDTNLTSSPYNQFPDIKARLITPASNGGINISPVVYPITAGLLPSQVNNRVKGKAYFHLVSPKMEVTIPGPTFKYTIPVTVSNNTILDGNQAVDHFFLNGELTGQVGLNETKLESISALQLMPNPAKENVTLYLQTTKTENISVSIFNTVGQLVKTETVQAQAGTNTVNINLTGISSGIYMVKVSGSSGAKTQKLIIE